MIAATPCLPTAKTQQIWTPYQKSEVLSVKSKYQHLETQNLNQNHKEEKKCSDDTPHIEAEKSLLKVKIQGLSTWLDPPTVHIICTF